MKTSQNKSNKN